MVFSNPSADSDNCGAVKLLASTMRGSVSAGPPPLNSHLTRRINARWAAYACGRAISVIRAGGCFGLVPNIAPWVLVSSGRFERISNSKTPRFSRQRIPISIALILVPYDQTEEA